MKNLVIELIKSCNGTLDKNEDCIKQLIRLGKPAIPYLLEYLAIDYENGWLVVSVVNRMREQTIDMVQDARGVFTYDSSRRPVLYWGRDNRYLLDWLCPECSMNYDAHILYGCHWEDGREWETDSS